MTKILGIDIGAKFVVAFSLSSLPVGMSYPDFYKRNAKVSISKIRMDNSKEGSSVNLRDAIALLEELKPDAIVMEPTGVWYSRLWAEIAEHLNIEVKWIGHGDLAHNRGAYGFKDKDDRTDAFCLAVSYFDPIFNARNSWLFWRTGAISQVNDRLLEIKSLESTTKILTQQIRQRLKYEFPEIADRAITNGRTKDGFTAWIGWLAGIHNYKRIENEYAKSIATELSIELSQYTRDHAAAIAGNEIREVRLKSDLCDRLLDQSFDRYRETLELFGFGSVMQATILTNVYPFEKFLLSGAPHVERYEDDRGKHKKNMSLSGFQISLGMGKRLIESGSSSALIYSGSSFARKMLYCWITTNVLPEKMSESWLVSELDKRALSNAKPALTVAQLRTRWKETKGTNKDRHMAGVRSAMTLGYRVTRLLYDELLKTVTS
ncbi:hypothetical protein [Chamaesiphon sp. VAR_48_metabat_403]|uniref:IS110 family transposase n=1 Tax=Chamaesiphon sp. VAR_48_metabat_403 TaxID=2964700 RepID=UPI00286D6D19|nr:hypothetical protein [Chamaesiphon sp. VAR_48_metabat_403]